MNASAYRSSDAVVEERIALLRAERDADPYRIAFALARRVAVDRIARAAAGTAATLSGACAFVFALASYGAWGEYPWTVEQTLGGLAEATLLGGWLLGVVVLAAGLMGASAALSPDPNAPAREPVDPSTELAELERHDPLRQMQALAARWEFAAAATPLAALSLLTPLTLHWSSRRCASRPRPTRPSGCDGCRPARSWSGMRTSCSWIASVLWARAFRRREAIEVRLTVSRSWAKALAVVVATGCLPGIVFLGLPPILVAVTGLVFIPAMYRHTASTLVRERGHAGRGVRG